MNLAEWETFLQIVTKAEPQHNPLLATSCTKGQLYGEGKPIKVKLLKNKNLAEG